jgi:NAD(P)-dependent dehydrogenase (short-subunit alcohol dehydrogenase family)
MLIYGGSGGIGSATARLLRADGCDVHLVARTAERLAEVADDIGATYTVGDVTDADLPPRVARESEGPWDGLVYAVGTITLRSFTRLTHEDFATDFQVNAMGAALAVQGALPMLKQSSDVASVVLFSSVAALQGFSFHASMGMAKGAVSGLTLSLAAELAPKVRVNAIAPSLTRTPLAQRVVSNEKMAEAIAGLHAIPRLGTADDIAQLTAFLLSPGAGWITGQIVSVDGGRSTLRTKN